MDATSDKIDNRRRNFLKMAATGAPVAAAATMALGAGMAKADPVLKTGKDAGYQETAHVCTYYEAARF